MKKGRSPQDMYTAFARCYDVVMRDVDYDGWARFLLELCRRNEFRRGAFLNLAIGTANLEPLLYNHFEELRGLDASAEMIRQAREKMAKLNLDVPVSVARMQDFRLPEKFDLIVCLYDSLNYVTAESEVAKTFRNAFRHLNPGGAFMFDVTTEYNIVQNFSLYTFAETFKDLAYIWENRYDIANKLAISDFTFFEKNAHGYVRSEERHVQRIYSNRRLRELLEAEGFEFVAMYDGFTFTGPVRTTERVHFVARKPQIRD